MQLLILLLFLTACTLQEAFGFRPVGPEEDKELPWREIVKAVNTDPSSTWRAAIPWSPRLRHLTLRQAKRMCGLLGGPPGVIQTTTGPQVMIIFYDSVLHFPLQLGIFVS